MIRVVHVISGLNVGGAETVLTRLLERLDRSIFDLHVISLTTMGPMAAGIAALNIPVTALNMPRSIPDPRGVLRLERLLRSLKPDIAQTWLYHSDLVGGVAARMAGVPKVVWNVRQGSPLAHSLRPTTRLTAVASALLSVRIPDRIIVNSLAGQNAHAELGYCAEKMVMIPNGFDTSQFKPDSVEHLSLRRKLGVPDDSFCIGMIARYDPHKDHASFINAMQLLSARHSNLCIVLCGTDVDDRNVALTSAISQRLRGRFKLLGLRQDVPEILRGLDIVCSSSLGEGFSNTIGEAMACGVPCVVTDVGDSKEIVANTGRAIPPKDPRALANACDELIALPVGERAKLGALARERIVNQYSLERITQRYASLWMSLHEAG